MVAPQKVAESPSDPWIRVRPLDIALSSVPSRFVFAQITTSASSREFKLAHLPLLSTILTTLRLQNPTMAAPGPTASRPSAKEIFPSSSQTTPNQDASLHPPATPMTTTKSRDRTSMSRGLSLSDIFRSTRSDKTLVDAANGAGAGAVDEGQGDGVDGEGTVERTNTTATAKLERRPTLGKRISNTISAVRPSLPSWSERALTPSASPSSSAQKLKGFKTLEETLVRSPPTAPDGRYPSEDIPVSGLDDASDLNRTSIIHDLFQQAKAGRLLKDGHAMGQVLKASAGGELDDREMMLENLVAMLSSMDNVRPLPLPLPCPSTISL